MTVDRLELDSVVGDDEQDLSLPPHSAQAEEAVLGSILKNRQALADVAAWLKPSDFYAARNRHVYAALHALFERGWKIDYHLLAEELTRQGTYEAAAGLLSELNLATPSAAHVEHYGQIVLERARRRGYISAAEAQAALAWNVRLDLETVKQRSEALVLAVSADTLGRKLLFSPSEWAPDLLEYLGEARRNGLAGVSTGLQEVDRLTLGLSKGWLYLLGARTGTGKTQLCGQVAVHVGEHHGPVAFVSMELTKEDLGVRFVAGMTNIRKELLVTGRLEEPQRQEVLRAINRLEHSRVHIAYGGGFTTADIRAFALQVQVCISGKANTRFG